MTEEHRTAELANMTEENVAGRAFAILVNDHHGVYSGQFYMEAYGQSTSGIDDETRASLLEGPGHVHYDESCSDLEDNGVLTDDSGKEWTLAWRDGGLFAVDGGLIDDWESVTRCLFDAW
jgi:hypothetical protein